MGADLLFNAYRDISFADVSDRDADFENAVGHGCFGFIGFDVVGEDDASAESAPVTFAVEPIFFAGGILRFALSSNGHQIAVNGDIDIFWLGAGYR